MLFLQHLFFYAPQLAVLCYLTINESLAQGVPIRWVLFRSAGVLVNSTTTAKDRVDMLVLVN